MAEDIPIPPKLVEVLTRIETKLDGVISGHSDHEHRMRKLETDLAALRTDVAQQKARVQGWLIGVGTAGGLGALSGITALVNALGGG